MARGVGLAWDLFASDHASPGFLRVAGAADKAAASTERATASMAAATARMGAVGAKLTKSVTLPLLALGAVATDQAMKYQKSMTLLQTAGGETAQKMAVISKGILDVATATGSSLHDLSDGMYVVAKAGGTRWTAVDQLKVLKAAAQGAKAENVDLGTAVNALTSVMASYGIKASDAVQAENMLIRGSGLAKTTFQDFAGALANVVPLASSLHISFAQVAGAVATMTQHGESAQRSTENLSNLISALAGQNNVASRMMQQLGINTVDLQKNLGHRGLTGTLDLVENALAKSSHGGMVVVSAFKQAKVGMESARTEIAKMPKDLAGLSNGLLAGDITRKTFLKDIGKMSFAHQELGRNFLLTARNALGFNDMLKSGKGDTMTAATALQKMLGGVTGMRTALMLGGASAKQFAANTNAVAKAAREGGVDVLGWAKTNDTLAVKMDKAKANLQVMAVEVGTALIPVVSKLADVATKVIHGFDGLSGTQKKIIGLAAVFLAALGPILAIGGRLAVVGAGISRFASNASARIASIAGASEETATKVGNITRGMVRGAMGIMAGAVAAQVGGNSSGGFLASILLGGAGGWAMGGPVGAAVGGVSAAIFKGVGLWNDHKKAAEAAALAEKQFVGTLTSAIEADNGALGTNLKLTLTKALQDKGVLDKATKLGVSTADVVAASMGSAKSKDKIAASLRSITSASRSMLDRILTPLHLYDEKATRNALLSGKTDLGNLPSDVHGNKVSLSASQRADAQAAIDAAKNVRGLGSALRGAGVDIDKARQKADQFAHALNDNRVSTGKFAAQLSALQHGSTTAMDANGNLIQSLARSTVVGQHNRAVFASLAIAANNDAAATLNAARKHESLGKAAHDANGVLAAHVSQIMKSAAAAHFNTTTVAGLVAQYLHLPRRVATELLKKGTTPADIQAILDKYGRVPKNISTRISLHGPDNIDIIRRQIIDAFGQTVYQNVVVNKTLGTSHPQPVPHAAGGSVGDGWFTVGERGYELGHKRGSHVDIFSNAQSRAMTGHDKVPGYASGTLTGSALSAVTGPMAAFLAAAHSTQGVFSDLASAAKDLRAAAHAQFGSLRLDAMARQRDSVRTQISNTQQARATDYSTVRSAVYGSFDVTTAGQSQQLYSDRPAAPTTAASILSALTTAASNARKFAGLLRTLARNGLPKSLLLQLASAGPSAMGQAQALAAATPKEILGIQTQYRSLATSAAYSGNKVADALTKGLLTGLLSQQTHLNTAIRKLADGMVAALKHRLGIRSPSRVMHGLGANTAEGFRLGVASKHAAIAAEANRMAHKTVDGATAAGSYVRQGDTFHIYEQTDPVGTAHTVQRMQQQRARL